MQWWVPGSRPARFIVASGGTEKTGQVVFQLREEACSISSRLPCEHFLKHFSKTVAYCGSYRVSHSYPSGTSLYAISTSLLRGDEGDTMVNISLLCYHLTYSWQEGKLLFLHLSHQPTQSCFYHHAKFKWSQLIYFLMRVGG